MGNGIYSIAKTSIFPRNGINPIASISVVPCNGINSIATISIVHCNGINSIATISVVPPELIYNSNECRRHEIYCNPEVLTPGITKPESNTSSAVGTTDILGQILFFVFFFLQRNLFHC
jgi:hypothetical protein